MSGRGRFVVLEGGEASGKSTQAARLADHLGAVLTREPGGTPLGARLRELLLDPDNHLAPRTEALLMAADRAQHVSEVIAPALAAGRHVVSDRFVGSSLAYQGFGRQLGADAVAVLSDFAVDGTEPDLVVLLDVPAADAGRRLAQRSTGVDRMEAEAAAFHQRVADGYRQIADHDPRWVVVDGRGTIDEVFARITSVVETRWPSHG